MLGWARVSGLSDRALRRAFGALWVGHALSESGTNATAVAVSLLVLAQTGSGVAAGACASAAAGGGLAVQFAAGWIGDRFDRRSVMCVCEAGTAVAVGSLVLAQLLDWFSVVHVAAVALTVGALFGLYRTAEMAALPRIVGPDVLPRVLTVNQARGYAAQLVGPPVGGSLFAVAPMAPFALHSVAGLVAVLLLRRVPRLPRVAADGDGLVAEGFVAKAVTGFRVIAAQPFTRATVVFVAVSDFLMNCAIFAVTLVVARGGSQALALGVVAGCAGVGGIAGAIAASRLPDRVLTVRRFLTVVPAVSAVLVLLIAVAPTTAVLGGVYGLLFVPWPAWHGLVVAGWMNTVRDDARAQLYAAATLASAGPSLVAPFAVGAALQVAPTTAVFVALATAFALLALATIAPAVQRSMTPSVDSSSR